MWPYGELIMRVNNEKVVFNNNFKLMEYPEIASDCFAIDIIEQPVIKNQKEVNSLTLLNKS